ncbi:MAG: hypothetical protein JNM95_02710 [Chitinophagaceae bacterium]|nr:hypothetical protein [Chitinophagaceae bacterium]
MSVTNLLVEIERKSKRLIQRNQRLEEENTALRNSVFEYLQKLDELKKEMANQEQEHLIQKTQKLSQEDKKAILKEIDKYVLLIDKCISSVKVSGII